MAALSDHSEALLLDWLMTTGTATRPTAWYVALYTAAPSDSGGGTEVSGNGYSRQAVTFAAATSPGGTTSNTGDITFTAAGGDWGTITHIGIFDASTAGNLLFHTPLDTSKTIDSGDIFKITSGNLSVTLA